MAEKNHPEEEVLEQIWMEQESERGKALKETILKGEHSPVTIELIDNMIRDGILVEDGGILEYTEKGLKMATRLIRSHRLAERLFTDILDIKDEDLESNACTFEHILSPELSTAICTLLGHPTQCPHGNPIPRGECCLKNLKEVKKVIFPLSELAAGESGKITYISTEYHKRLDQLIGLGISPGNTVRVHQTVPTFVIRVGETDIALDREICAEIYLRPLTPG
ncbi:MAG: metal-dependent transcriptional regulator [Spirochaetales bacterium]|nr:metal-dependent transcriptional regulator [Spirochaetales bacterium]